MKVHVVPVLHPAFILRGNYKEEPSQVLYLQRAKEIAQNGWVNFDSTKPPRGAITKPNLEDLSSWLQHIGPGGVTVDIETARRRLRGVGFCTIDTHLALWVPLCSQGGGAYWSSKDEGACHLWLRDILRDPGIPKYFHNGLAFDIPILRHNGYVVNGYAGDTMLMNHIAYPEMSKGLKYLANLYLGIGGWKALVSESDEGEDK